MPSRVQREENPGKAYLRHYHKAAQNTVPIDSKSRRDLEILRSRMRSRVVKWCAISLLLLSTVLATMLSLSKTP